MLLTSGQRERLAGMIIDFLGGSRWGPAVVLFGPAIARSASKQQLSDYAYAEWLLREALRQPTVDVFAHALMLLDPPGELREVHLHVQRVVAGEVAWEGGETDPLWMPPEAVDSPFADRDGLRTALGAMADGAGFPAITIEAPMGHGKRTMCHYIEHCANRYGKFDPVVVHLQRLDTDYVVPHLVNKLWIRLGLPGEPTTPVAATADRRAIDMAVELTRKALLSPTPVWFVANVVRSDLDDGVWTFLDELLRVVRTDPLVASKLKVTVLADFSAVELPNKPEVDARFTLPEIGVPEIAAWLAAAVPDKDERLYTVAASIVMEKVAKTAPPPAMRLATIAERCVVARRELLAAP
ncbi:hypothetical protein [Actinokineospora sp. HUAS TT18]|uniref:hypothetical protein n=1 Tax=Actinokineospora sp. HUAS TT18 TaxID=3447451 RepID=UPI003F525D91